MNKTSGYWLAVLLVAGGAACYGVMSPLLKLAYNGGFRFEQLTVHQTGAGGALLWLLMLLRPARWRYNRFDLKQWTQLSFIGIFGLCMTTVFYNQTLERLDASFSIVLLFQFMWITILLECLWHKRWPAATQWAAIVLAMTGTVLAAGLLDRGALDALDWSGVWYGLASAVTYSLFLLLTGKVKSDYDPVMKSAIMMTAGFVCIALLFGYKSAGDGLAAEWTLLGWGIALGLLGQAFPALFFNAGIPRIGSGLASLLGALELPFAAISAWLILGEPITPVTGAGMALILCGIAAAEYGSRKQTVQTEGLEE
ncbi:DMT family transporter [Paenibacillus sp. NEAU-GSW1]|uniref:EamA family transporter n=1 Tax=Paenibacillus sp. NEAU-GSW1 TaxID=2682486 RepID=UPI0012E16D40|nr:DMT family transporter [Paenibacillus sp. NEAU-GSW1]MUT68000.1 EamA family transporter [Paenibacillus sp. NEAU-GSW1]